MTEPSPGGSLRRVAITALKVLVSAALVALIIWRIGLDRLRESLSGVNPWWLGAAAVVFTASNLLGAVQWAMLLRARGIGLSLRQVVGYYFVGLFLNNFLIGYVGGDAFRVFDAARASGNTAGAVSSVLFDRLVGFATLTSVAVVAAVAWHHYSGHATSLTIAGGVLILWVLVLLFFFSRRFARPIVYVFNRVLPLGLKNRAKQVYDQVNEYRHQRALLGQVLALSLVVQLLRIGVHYLTALALGVRVSFAFFLVFVPIIAFLASLPISVGGIGVREQSGVLLFTRVGVPEAAAVAMQFLAYLVGVIATVPGGVILSLRREQSRAAAQAGRWRPSAAAPSTEERR
ncbi:MAG: flippase-like domain-containing protein [candidate division KSB1 bacterium]|nr:flippase-like domain-containing protein [candidate division KSB1 bacterium]